MLEDRLVPAQYLWTNGTSDGLVSTAANWTDLLSGPSAVPGSGDYAYFGAGGSNTSATVDLSSWSVDRIVMDANFTATLAVPSGNAVTTNNHFIQYGTLQLTGSAALTAGTYFDINGAVVTSGSNTLTATLTTTGSFFLGASASITVTGAGPALAISTGGFEASGDIAVGTGSSAATLSITGAFDQDASSTIDVLYGSTLAFATGGTDFPVLEGAVNLLGNLTTDTVLALSGGTLDVLPSPSITSSIAGDVAIYNDGILTVGNGSASTNLAHLAGSMIVGAFDTNSSPTGGTLNLVFGGVLAFPYEDPSTFVVTPHGAIEMYGGTIFMDLTRMPYLEIQAGDETLPPGVLRSHGISAGIVPTVNFIGGDVVNHGLIEFTGYLHILALSSILGGGSYTQSDTGVLSMRLNDTPGSDILAADSAVDLDGTLVLTALESLTANQSWALIGSGNLTGDFASIVWPDGNPAWQGIPGSPYLITN